MKTYQRLALGVLLGALLGAALATGIIHALPEDHKLNTVNAWPFVEFLQFVTCDIRLNSEHFLIGSGAVMGAMTGILLARVIPYQKQWLAAFLALLAGIFIGGIAIYFPSVKWLEQTSAMWEHQSEGARALATLYNLKAIDRATTNQLYLVNFQQRGRETLTNYIHEAERREPNLITGSATNDVAYQICKKYLATH